MICQHDRGIYTDQEGNVRCVLCDEILEDALKDCEECKFREF